MPFVHRNLTGSDAVHPAAYVSASDPGAVGSDKFWVDTSSGPPFALKKRNSTNTGWQDVGASASTLFSDAEGDPANISDTAADGTSSFAARRDHVHNGFSDAEGNPADVGATASDGTSDFAARREHVHKLGLITTRGDLIRGGSGGTPERFALGTIGQVVTSNGTDAVWAAPSGGGGGGGSGALVPIQVVGPLTVAAASMAFSSIPQTGFRNLRIRGVARSTTSATSTTILMQVNGDTGSNYDSASYQGNSTSTMNESIGGTTGIIGAVTAATAPASIPTAFDVDLPIYTGTTYQKVWRSYTHVELAASSTNVRPVQASGTWKSTAAVNAITLSLGAGSFDVGSYACLYGEMDTAGVLLTPGSNLLYETTLTAAAASIDTGILSQAYKDLRIEIAGLRSSNASDEVGFRLNFNGDTGNNYDWSRMSNSNTSVTGSEGVAVGFINNVTTTTGVAGNNSTAGTATSISISVPGYTSTTYWKVATLHTSSPMGTVATAGNRRPVAGMGVWRNTGAISSVQISLSSGNIMAGAILRVYGEPVSAGGSSVGTGTRLRIGSNQSITSATATLINWDTEDSDADNQHYTSAAAISGTVTKTAASATLSGTSTSFTTELSVGQVISVPGTADEKRVVIAIASNTSLTVNTAYVNSASSQTCTRVNSAVVFRQAGFYSLETNIYSAALSTGAVTLAYYLNNLTTATSGTAIGQRDPTAINAAAGYELVLQRQFQQWDFVEVVWTQNSGGAVNVTADERTHFSISARPTVTVAVPYVNIQDQQTSGTASGTFTSGAWQTRPLNTVHSNSGGVASLTSNQITLPPGTYRVAFQAVAAAVDRHQTRVQNVTDATTLALGVNNFAPASGTHENASHGSGRFTLSGIKTIELQHRCQTTRSTDGFGFPASWGTEVYAVIELWKEG